MQCLKPMRMTKELQQIDKKNRATPAGKWAKHTKRQFSEERRDTRTHNNERSEIYQTVHPSDWQKIRKLEADKRWQECRGTEVPVRGISLGS